VSAACLIGGASEKQAATGSPPPAPACQAPDDGRDVATMAIVIESLRRHAAERPPGAVVVKSLDNRGHNYRPEADNRGHNYRPETDPFAAIPMPEPPAQR
jgi:hypothetical protein